MKNLMGWGWVKPASAMAPQAPVRLRWGCPGWLLPCGIALCFQLQMESRAQKEKPPSFDFSANPVKSFWLLTPCHQLHPLLYSEASSPFTPASQEGETRWRLLGAGCLPLMHRLQLWGLLPACRDPGRSPGVRRAQRQPRGQDCCPHAERSMGLPCQVSHGVVVGPPAPPKGG